MYEHGGHIALRHDVRIVHRAEHTILFRAHNFRAIRVGGAAKMLLPALRQGTQWTKMYSILRDRYPDDPHVTLKLDGFLSRLDAADLLNSSKGEPTSADSWRRWEMLDLNPIADRIVRLLAGIPLRVGNVALFALVGLAILGVLLALPHVGPLTFRGIVKGAADPWGIAFLLLVILPLHELAHSVACRAAGVPVSGAGVLLHCGIIPGPFVDTSMIYAVTDRWKRFRVPIVGPLVDLGAAGAAAWLRVYPGDAKIDGPLESIMILGILCFLLNVNPFFPTDGSRAIEALLDDELARKAALARYGATLSGRRSIWTYRLACVLYLWIITSLVVMAWAASLR